jgi:hypothetical protein
MKKTKYTALCAYGSISYNSYNSEWRENQKREEQQKKMYQEELKRRQEEVVFNRRVRRGVRIFEEYRRLKISLSSVDGALRGDIIARLKKIQTEYSYFTPEIKEAIFEIEFRPGTVVNVVCNRIISNEYPVKKICGCKFTAELSLDSRVRRMFLKAFKEKEHPLIEVVLYDRHKCIKCFRRSYDKIMEEGTAKKSHCRFRKELKPLEVIEKNSLPLYD